jgi:hypothetical protein
LRGFDVGLRRITAVLALMAGACAGQTIVAVDPYPCGDAAVNGCPRDLFADLIGYWRLDEAKGSKVARDMSGRGNDGALVGVDADTAWAAGGPAGGSLSPQGTGYVEVGRSPSIDSIANQVTVAAWIYLDGTIAEYATAISRQIGDGWNQLYHLSVNAAQKAALFIDNAQTFVFLESPSLVPQQTWTHLAGTWDGDQARLYVDGREVARAPISGPYGAETNPVILSGNGNGPSRAVSESVPGRLAAVMLYRRALAGEEIAKLATGVPPPNAADAGR